MVDEVEYGELERAYSGKKLLVVGAFGFLGSHYVNHALKAQASVTALDVDTSKDRQSLLNILPDLRDRVEVVEGDITGRAFVEGHLSDSHYDQIVNFAASATVIERAVQNPLGTIAANTLGTVNLLEAARHVDGLGCFLQVSSDKVYGEPASGEDPSFSYDEEKTALRGVGLYDASKLAADVFARTWYEVFGLPTVVARLCNVFGPYDLGTLEYRLVPRAMTALFAASPSQPELYFEALQHRRDYVYVDDAIRALMLLGARTGSGNRCVGQAYNVPGAQNLSTPEMCGEIVQSAIRIEEQLGSRVRATQMRKNGLRVVNRDHDGVVTINIQHADGEKLCAATGFRPNWKIPAALDETARFYRKFLRTSA